MPNTAQSGFEVTGWDQAPYDERPEGPSLARATVTKTFSGDSIRGISTAELLMCQADTSDLAAGAGYVASERFEGEVEGKPGTFVMQHAGLSGPDSEPVAWGHIVPGSGTGELAGITGTVELTNTPETGHVLMLEYDL